MRDYIKLHFIILLWGLTGVFGKLIDLPSVEVVFIRTGIAALALAILASRIPKESRRGLSRENWRYFFTGLLIGLHWILFFLAVKISNSVSVCMVGMATVAFWSAVLEPLFVRGRRFKLYELALGLIMVAAILMIYRKDFEYQLGLTVALAAALAGTLFSIANGGFARRAHHHVIAAYQMLGACVFSALSLPISAKFLSDGKGIDLVPGGWDWVWLVALSIGCTVYAYAEYVELLKRLTVFTINLAYNLEPVYGIVLGALLFAEYKYLSPWFFVGAAIILATVLIHPFVRNWFEPARSD